MNKLPLNKKIDGAPEENSGHRRRALHAIVAKAYRGNGKIYNFIKSKIALYECCAEKAPIHQADRHALLKWLQENPDCRLSTVKKDFWTLARFCPADVHKTIDHIDQVDSTSVKQVVSYLVAAAPMALQKKLIERFNINLALVNSDVFYNGLVRSTLRDVLISEKDLIQNQNGIGIDQTLRLLEEKIQNILNSVGQESITSCINCVAGSNIQTEPATRTLEKSP